jgi:hypothetical protein
MTQPIPTVEFMVESMLDPSTPPLITFLTSRTTQAYQERILAALEGGSKFETWQERWNRERNESREDFAASIKRIREAADALVAAHNDARLAQLYAKIEEAGKDGNIDDWPFSKMHAGPGADAGAMPDPNLTTPPNCIQPMNRASFKKTNFDGIIRWQWQYKNLSGVNSRTGVEVAYPAIQIGHSITRSEIAAKIRMIRDYLKQHIAKDLADFKLEQRKKDAGAIDFLARLGH